MTVHQVLVAAAPHDAITNDALALRSHLQEFGASQVYAHHIDPGLAGTVRPLGSFPADVQGPILFHASIGDPAVTSFLLGRQEPVALVYHNITPPELFEQHDPTFAALLRAGRDDLRMLRARVAVAMADSAFNADDLRTLGYDDVVVAPLVVDFERLAETAADPPTRSRLDGASRPLCLFVGQLLPHKRPELLVQAFHVLRTYLSGGGTLVLAGAARSEGFASSVRQFVAELALPDVWVTGSVPDAELAALYRGADVFVTASEHEGFCIPILEAMASDVPVVARSFAAVPDTVGSAGILLDAADGPAVIAEAMLEAATAGPVREELIVRGRRRVTDFRATDGGAVVANEVRRLVA